MLKSTLLKLIRLYQSKGGGQALFSTDCNFEPSCSEYTYQAIDQYGVITGVKLGLSRLRRCNQPDCVCKCIEPVAREP